MDEERRTSLNLAACVAAASERLIFINTGFLDRCASEISSVGACGPVLGKEAQKSEPWFQAYEENNVAVGLSCGLPGKGQIGKGMWSAPDEMRKMLATKAVGDFRITKNSLFSYIEVPLLLPIPHPIMLSYRRIRPLEHLLLGCRRLHLQSCIRCTTMRSAFRCKSRAYQTNGF
jgi:hypothetical protein